MDEVPRQLAEKRYNTLYLWNGHPFTSLLKLPKYPEAQELPTAQLDHNIAIFRWLTAEADKRGIWVLQGFYNIHLSHAFARAHHLPYHLSAPNPLSRTTRAMHLRVRPRISQRRPLDDARRSAGPALRRRMAHADHHSRREGRTSKEKPSASSRNRPSSSARTLPISMM